MGPQTPQEQVFWKLAIVRMCREETEDPEIKTQCNLIEQSCIYKIKFMELNTIQKQFYEWKWTREARAIMFLGHKAIMDSPFFKEQGPDVKAYVR